MFEQRSNSKSDPPKTPGVSYINCRVIDASLPSGMAQALANMALPRVLSGMGDTTLNVLQFGQAIISAILPAIADKHQTPIGELNLSGEKLSAAFAKITSEDLTIRGVIAAYSRHTQPVEITDPASSGD